MGDNLPVFWARWGPCGGLDRVEAAFVSAWCGRRDLNPHDSRHGNLNPARLPVPPRPQGAPSALNRYRRATQRLMNGRRTAHADVWFGGFETLTLAHARAEAD